MSQSQRIQHERAHLLLTGDRVALTIGIRLFALHEGIDDWGLERFAQISIRLPHGDIDARGGQFIPTCRDIF